VADGAGVSESRTGEKSMKKFVSFRQGSREDLGQDVEANSYLCIDQLKAGALLRIADASEKMAQNHIKLMADRDMYYRWYEDGKKRILELEHRIAGLKGYIKRLEKRV
jgi:hypothetical protein